MCVSVCVCYHAGQNEEAHNSDNEVEDAVRDALQSDVLASYDIDVTEEGELISTYSAMLATARSAAMAT